MLSELKSIVFGLKILNQPIVNETMTGRNVINFGKMIQIVKTL